MTGTQIAELAKRLGIEIEELINQDHFKYRKKFTFQNFSCEDWITMVQNRPEIKKTAHCVERSYYYFGRKTL